jgi:hypothetical protein
MSDTPRSGRPSDFDEDLLNILIHAGPRETTRELASEVGCDHATTFRQLQSLGKVQIWEYGCRTFCLKTRISVSPSVLLSLPVITLLVNNINIFLCRIDTGDESGAPTSISSKGRNG